MNRPTRRPAAMLIPEINPFIPHVYTVQLSMLFDAKANGEKGVVYADVYLPTDPPIVTAMDTSKVDERSRAVLRAMDTAAVANMDTLYAMGIELSYENTETDFASL